jgi:hypothetical protein
MSSKLTSPLLDPANRDASLRAQAAAFRDFSPGEASNQ